MHYTRCPVKNKETQRGKWDKRCVLIYLNYIHFPCFVGAKFVSVLFQFNVGYDTTPILQKPITRTNLDKPTGQSSTTEAHNEAPIQWANSTGTDGSEVSHQAQGTKGECFLSKENVTCERPEG